MLSQSAEYVLRIVVYLASQRGAAQTTRQIAAATRVPEGYLSKLLQGLAKHGLVESHRGLHGGFILARHPETLTVYEVISAIDPIRRIEICPLHRQEHGSSLCRLHRCLDTALASVENIFRNKTIAQFLDDADEPGAQICPLPVELGLPQARN